MPKNLETLNTRAQAPPTVVERKRSKERKWGIKRELEISRVVKKEKEGELERKLDQERKFWRERKGKERGGRWWLWSPATHNKKRE